MSDEHKGIRCDYCQEDNFTDIRYACLVCENYDLCETCFEGRHSNLLHKPYHPMQQILTEEEFSKRLDESESEEVYTFRCPYCGDDGFTASNLIAHCGSYHYEGGHPVRCPICLVYQRVNVRFLNNTFYQHVQNRHHEYCTPAEEVSNSNEAQECPICIEQMLSDYNIRYLSCTHQFHSECINVWLQNNSSCPVCRIVVD
ncbi:E3 ubiquitin-protein ligase KCMF1-like [Aedes albopictus]|uniref:RING-type E3 ubiquitin transferase KCMF1 n=1 Tax=Aedes albopictus TaxID=7160 RepID=A0ABM1YTN0_AEDAL